MLDLLRQEAERAAEQDRHTGHRSPEAEAAQVGTVRFVTADLSSCP
jgi:hypothetical protein